MFGFFQFGQPQFADAPIFGGEPPPPDPVRGPGAGVMFNGDQHLRRLKNNEARHHANMQAIELTLRAFLTIQDDGL